MDSSVSNIWTGTFSIDGLSGFVFNPNSVDPDRTPRSRSTVCVDVPVHVRCLALMG